MQGMNETNRELLGVCYETFGTQSEIWGQHFTPHSVCELVAEMLANNTDPRPPITIADPACGSGRMLVVAAEQHDLQTICFGMDKDVLCAEMTALNLCLYNLDGAVMHGDSLTTEQHRAWRTRSTPLGGEVVEVDPGNVPWPEAALDQDESGEGEEAPDNPDRVDAVGDGGGLDQSDLRAWLE